MDEDGSGGRDGSAEAVIEAVERAKRELGRAVGHGVKSVRNWVGERWLPIRFLLVGGFSWAMGKAFGWLLNLLVELGIWLASVLRRVIVQSTFGTQLLILFFGVYVLHSLGQTKLIWGIKTNLVSMTSDERSRVRTDGGTPDEIWLPAGAIGGIIIGAAIGWSFGLEGIFVGAGLGWVLGDEYDKWFDDKFMRPVSSSQEDGRHSE